MTYEDKKNVPFFYKERKRTQRSECSFEKNGCPTLKKTQYIFFTKNQDAKSTNLPLFYNNNPNIDEAVQLKIPFA